MKRTIIRIHWLMGLVLYTAWPGSGALVLMIMIKSRDPFSGILYLLIFGGGSVLGMLVASGLFSIPFSKRIIQGRALKIFLIAISSGLCLIFGSKVIYENLIA